LPAVAFDPANALNIAKKDFDSEDPETWGFTDPDRRIYALAFHNGRLFYSVVGGSQIWSVGFDKITGAFENAAQWEIDVPKKPKNLAVTDIVFTHKGAMILAQRGEIKSTYDYANFADAGKSRTYRYWLESPKDDPTTPSRWIAEPEEYAVGFDDTNRATDGGLALNYGYDKFGYIDTRVCEATLWTTGDNLRRGENPELVKALLPGGPLVIDGLQGMPAGPVIDKNLPPWATYMLDVEPSNTDMTLQTDDPLQWSDITTQGWMGDIAIYHPCGGGAGDVAQYYGGAGYPWSYPPYIEVVDGGCTPGKDCPEPPKACVIPQGEFECNPRTGTLTYHLGLTLNTGLKANAVKILNSSPGVKVTNGPVINLGASVNLELGTVLPGQLISIPICIFDKSAMETGQPFDCCKTTVTLKAPLNACVKK
jgi:hypothetical protein